MNKISLCDFSDLMTVLGYERCSLCDLWTPEADLLMVVVDEPGVRQPVCPECLATLERVG